MFDIPSWNKEHQNLQNIVLAYCITFFVCLLGKGKEERGVKEAQKPQEKRNYWEAGEIKRLFSQSFSQWQPKSQACF